LEKKVTNALNKELEKDELFVNLASNEYFSAVDTKELKVAVVTLILRIIKMEN
jgi:cytoplasmic iron level regulating protein YaaA (DUF328/UPF0246 family)